jgi:hypothetical protein
MHVKIVPAMGTCLAKKSTTASFFIPAGTLINTLATRGLEENFFQLCCCVSFLFWREIGFGFTYCLCT